MTMKELTTNMWAVWRHFTPAMPTSSMANYSICKANVLMGGSGTAKYNTTNLIKHLKEHQVNVPYT